MRVLVTGATGFVGSHLIEELNRKAFDVNVLVRRRWSKSLPTWLNHTNIIYGDVTDTASVEAAVKGVDVVFHLASLLGRWQSEYNEAEYSKVNVIGTKLLVAASQKYNVSHFIDLSTAGVMGRLVNVPADETHPLAPQFPYEKSKYLAELFLKTSMKKDLFPATIVRATHIYGPRDKNTVKIFKLMKKIGMFPLIGGGHNLFQPLYVRDLVEALMLCMEKVDKSMGRTYLVAGKDVVTYREFLLLSAKLLGIHITTIPVSENLAKFVASVSENVLSGVGFEPPLTRSRVEFFSRDQTYKIERIEKEIGFFPETNLSTGLKLMINWCDRNNLWSA